MASDPSRPPRCPGHRRLAPGLVHLMLLLASPPAWTGSPPAPPEGRAVSQGKPDPRPKGDHRAGELTPEERKHLDQVLAQAWKDPAVMSARDQVHAATDAYRMALRDAVERVDPSAVPLMGKLHDKSRLEAVRRKLPMDGPAGMPPPLPKDPEATIQVLANQEANARHLEGADRDRFFELARQIQTDGTLKEPIRQTYETWTRGGRDAAKARKDLREKLLTEMRQRDPWAASLLSSEPPPRKAPDKPPENAPPLKKPTP
ncbi:MAG: hypothetical protein KGS60_11620 [Verrucomicrobia bacterium]|nr:hypothetical protein [Verrucomicrobiota bacterium]